MDKIFIQELKVETHLGVPEWERMVAQTIILDIELELPNSKSCQTDAIADTLDYSQIVARIREMLTEKSFHLVETLAEHVCQIILKEFGSPWVKVKVAKPGILPGVKALGVVIERAT
jgi:7,8-dihydroneopterin aldolase/epimerase/oxygenase